MRNILLVIEVFTKVAEYVAELGLDVAKEHYDKRIDGVDYENREKVSFEE